MATQQLARLWITLQRHVNLLLAGGGTIADTTAVGLKQLIEKKEGLFRQNMMGKRVNHAARSVISPDPYIGVGEIGLPPYFAQRLTFPEHVNRWNADKLVRAVEAGAEGYPGAHHVDDTHQMGSVLHLEGMPRRKREKVAKLITMAAAEAEGGTGTPLPSPAKGVAGLPNGGASAGAPWGGSMGPHGAGVPHRVVHRHAVSGDVVLVNRQPTLHKPSILAHNVRVLRGERTVRLHYANCR